MYFDSYETIRRLRNKTTLPCNLLHCSQSVAQGANRVHVIRTYHRPFVKHFATDSVVFIVSFV